MASDKTVMINAHIEVSPSVLEAVTAQVKTLRGKGGTRLDSADLLNIMISQFLSEKDFEAYIQDSGNYPIEISGS